MAPSPGFPCAVSGRKKPEEKWGKKGARTTLAGVTSHRKWPSLWGGINVGLQAL